MKKKGKNSDEVLLEKKLENLKTYIRRVLQQTDNYRKEMTHQVEVTASTLLIFRKIRDEIFLNDEKPTVIEKSRENEDRIKENPLYNLYAKYDDLLRRDLRALKMNQELNRGRDEKGKDDEEANDPIKELLKKQEDEE